MNKYLKTNLANWEARVPVHAASRFYDLKGFLRGRGTLLPLEVKEVGPVKGKKLLHLQCHLGLDTLSWARRGAQVTGADFSPSAIAKARELAESSGLKGEFVVSDIYSLPGKLRGKFDVVFASYGVFCWIDDLNRWFRSAAHFLKPGGFVYVADEHPFASIFDDTGRRMDTEYFRAKPLRLPPGPTYTDRAGKKMPPTYEWWHTISDILDSVRSSGLRLDWFREHPFGAWPRFPGMRKRPDGRWYLPNGKLPLLFSLKAFK